MGILKNNYIPSSPRAKPKSDAMAVDKEKPPTGNKSKKKRMKIPILLRERYAFATSSGSKSAKILEPSSGGIGSKLKIASKIL